MYGAYRCRNPLESFSGIIFLGEMLLCSISPYGIVRIRLHPQELKMDEYLGNGWTYRYQISNTDRSRRPLCQPEVPSSFFSL
jgi:hypothetical protein